VIAPTLGSGSPYLNPRDLVGKTSAEIGQAARDAGLILRGPDPDDGEGSYIDPVTGQQRVLIHPEYGHFHVNSPAGERLDIDGRIVAPESSSAHLPLGR